MYKGFLAATLLGLFVLGYSVDAHVVNTEERGYITVNTQANKELTPDLVEISIAVETYDKSLQNAIAKNKEISDNVQNVLKSLINSDSMDYIKTADFSATPMYVYINKKREFDKYRVSNSVIVHTKNLENVGAMIDKSISVGATNVNNLNFSISDYESQCSELLNIATVKAKKQANTVANAAGTSISGIKYMNVNCNSGATTRVHYNLMAKNVMTDSAEGAIEPSTPITAGKIKVQATLNSAFFIK